MTKCPMFIDHFLILNLLRYWSAYTFPFWIFRDANGRWWLYTKMNNSGKNGSLYTTLHTTTHVTRYKPKKFFRAALQIPFVWTTFCSSIFLFCLLRRERGIGFWKRKFLFLWRLTFERGFLPLRAEERTEFLTLVADLGRPLPFLLFFSLLSSLF